MQIFGTINGLSSAIDDLETLLQEIAPQPAAALADVKNKTEKPLNLSLLEFLDNTPGQLADMIERLHSLTIDIRRAVL